MNFQGNKGWFLLTELLPKYRGTLFGALQIWSIMGERVIKSGLRIIGIEEESSFF